MKPTAYPELLDAAAWSVREDAARPRVEFRDLVMSVPLGATQSDRFVRLHESAHVAWTPRNKPASKIAAKLNVPEVLLQCAEDSRMAHMLRRVAHRYASRGSRVITEALDRGGLTPARIRTLTASVIAQARSGEPTALAALTAARVASYCTGDAHAIGNALWDALERERAAMQPHEVENVEYVIEQSADIASDALRVAYDRFRHSARRKKGPTFKVAEKLAVDVAARLAAAAPTSWARRGLQLNAAGDGLESTGEAHDDAVMRGAKESRAHDHSDAQWGDMTRCVLPMVRPLRGAVSVKRTATQTGIVPRRIDRWVTDKAVFDRSRRAMGGTVLMDASGSMNVEHEEVAALAAASPNMTVAMYSGLNLRGVLSVIADKGRCATSAEIYRARNNAGYSNIIDGPALRWLARSKGPRLWVSDAQVFGRCDRGSQSLRAEVDRICRSASIIRVPSVPAALEAYKLLRRSRGRITPSNVAALNAITAGEDAS